MKTFCILAFLACVATADRVVLEADHSIDARRAVHARPLSNHAYPFCGDDHGVRVLIHVIFSLTGRPPAPRLARHRRHRPARRHHRAALRRQADERRHARGGAHARLGPS